MYFIGENNEVLDPLKIKVLVNNRPVYMEIDSGARRSMIPAELYLKRFRGCKLKIVSS